MFAWIFHLPSFYKTWQRTYLTKVSRRFSHDHIKVLSLLMDSPRKTILTSPSSRPLAFSPSQIAVLPPRIYWSIFWPLAPSAFWLALAFAFVRPLRSGLCNGSSSSSSSSSSCERANSACVESQARKRRRRRRRKSGGGKGNEVTKERMGEGVKREIASKFQLLVLTTADHE